jgi:hypothetical protein
MTSSGQCSALGPEAVGRNGKPAYVYCVMVGGHVGPHTADPMFRDERGGFVHWYDDPAPVADATRDAFLQAQAAAVAAIESDPEIAAIVELHLADPAPVNLDAQSAELAERRARFEVPIPALGYVVDEMEARGWGWPDLFATAFGTSVEMWRRLADPALIIGADRESLAALSPEERLRVAQVLRASSGPIGGLADDPGLRDLADRIEALADPAPVAEGDASRRSARDVLADRIQQWADTEDWHVYDYVDRLLIDLDKAGFEVVNPGSVLEARDLTASERTRLGTVERVLHAAFKGSTDVDLDMLAAEILDELERARLADLVPVRDPGPGLARRGRLIVDVDDRGVVGVEVLGVEWTDATPVTDGEDQ